MITHEVVPIDYAFKRDAYNRINKLRMMYDYCKDDSILKRINNYKKIIRSLRTYIIYRCNHKGLSHSILVQADSPRLKYAYLCREALRDRLKLLRQERRTPKHNSRIFADTRYEMIGGVHKVKGSILKLGRALARSNLVSLKRPTTNDNYVGIEVECYGILSRDDLESALIERKMHKWARTISDGSIQATDERPYPIELNFMFKESELDEKMKEINEVLQVFEAEANKTCGLHVHLDARHRDPAVMFHNLVLFQDLLFRLNPSRIGNTYCQPVKTNDIMMSQMTNHYAAISSCSYQKYRTIEVRIHQGTVDVHRMKMWVKLLTKIANYPSKMHLENKSSVDLEDIPQVDKEEVEFFRSAV